MVGAVIAIRLSGCTPTIAAQGQSGTIVTFSGLGLNARLPKEMDVLTVAAAAEATLLERGYVITRRHGTSGRTTIHAATPALGWRRHVERSVVFRAIQKNRTVQVEIAVDPMPSEAESRAIFDGTLAQLGL